MMEKTNINPSDNKDIFKQEEARANVLTSYAILSISVISILLMGLSLSGLTVNSLNTAFSIAFTCIVIFIAIAAGITGILLKGRYGWLKYLLLIVMLFGVGFNRAIRSYYGLVLCLIPLVLSIRYLSKKFTIIMTVITNIMVTLAQLISVKIGILDLNMIELDPGTVLVIPQGADSLLKTAVRTAGFSEYLYYKNTIIYIIGFNLLEITILGYICSRIAAFAKDMVLRHAEISRLEAGVKKELDLAAAIQSNIIPKIFPPFPNRKEFELYALTKPAKEVGGDFYDFFLLDEDHLCLVIADVSGKGIPAALFMMVAKSLIKNRALMGGSPGEIISDVNNQLNDGNVNKMFVTVWFAILTISTGELREVNAGHEKPAIKRANGVYTFYNNKHSFVVGTKKNTKYNEDVIKLNPGDVIFTYTDGVAEASDNSLNQFGTERLLVSLNSYIEREDTYGIKEAERPMASSDLADIACSIDSQAESTRMSELLLHIKQDVDEFVGDADQFDDCTMLALQYNGPVTNN